MKTKDQKRQEATMRQEAHGRLSPEERLAKLNAGGFRATRERRKLEAQITKKAA